MMILEIINPGFSFMVHHHFRHRSPMIARNESKTKPSLRTGCKDYLSRVWGLTRSCEAQGNFR